MTSDSSGVRGQNVQLNTLLYPLNPTFKIACFFSGRSAWYFYKYSLESFEINVFYLEKLSLKIIPSTIAFGLIF
jgi:hypothetical protein